MNDWHMPVCAHWYSFWFIQSIANFKISCSHWPCIRIWTISPADVVTQINIAHHILQHPKLEPSRDSVVFELIVQHPDEVFWVTWVQEEQQPDCDWLQLDSVMSELFAPPPFPFSPSSSSCSQGSSSSSHASCSSSRRLPCPTLSPAFEKSNIGQKVRPNYPVILITAVNGVSLVQLSPALFKQYMGEHTRRGSGTGHVG